MLSLREIIDNKLMFLVVLSSGIIGLISYLLVEQVSQQRALIASQVVTQPQRILTTPTNLNGNMFPDRDIRRIIEPIRVNDVAYLRLRTIHNPLFLDSGEGDGNILVTDKSLISGFLLALRHAETSLSATSDRGDTLEIGFKQQGHAQRENIFLNFLAGVPGRSFGSEFDGMLHRLEAFQAAATRRLIREKSSQIQFVDIKGYRAVHKRGELKQLIGVLTRVDTREFAFTASHMPCWMRLHLRDGRKITLPFVLGYYKQARLNKPDALPAPFRDYYVHTVKTRQDAYHDESLLWQ